MGRSTAECVADVERELGRRAGFDLAAEYEQQVLDRQRGDLAAVPGVRELLDWVRAAGLPTCVASSGTPTEIAHRLAVTGLGDYLGQHRYSASMVRRGKPAPDLFLLAAERIGADPSDCALIEDSAYGVQAGKAAGMTVIGYATIAPADTLRAAGADHLVTAWPTCRPCSACNTARKGHADIRDNEEPRRRARTRARGSGRTSARPVKSHRSSETNKAWQQPDDNVALAAV